MNIWVDADACPGVIKEILVRAAVRAKAPTTFVANRSSNLPSSPYLKQLVVNAGFDIADNEIVQRVEPGDLVVTSDIPLAAEVIAKGGQALSHRGELFTKDTIRSRLNMRDFLDTMRASGLQSGGPPPLSQKDRKTFADNLDRILANRL